MERILANVPEGFVARPLQPDDYDKGYFELLQDLTVAPQIPRGKFQEIYSKLSNYPYFIVVLEDTTTQKLAGSGTLFVEHKFIRGGGKVGHIEDIVVGKNYQKRGLGKRVIEILTGIAKFQSCYKVLLDCDQDVAKFYEKCGYKQKGVWMSLYFDSPSL